ncbi:hypothetical protein BDR04DRAFT_1110887 [Suillus decipiens]|nr:hypothetical protein BDR04DRAFT_1110887 [Suillus decipiens]
MLNARRIKDASKVNRQCRSATQPWKKSHCSRRLFCGVCGTRDSRRITFGELVNICIRTF